ncbi:hypothetical protein KPSA1_04953 [Pseudomonas syringae pv. actinidiae]|uniref:Uncharacterized protein n=1 Tax=Pseudomonas syringae pv. actinidiae TaxID=103796 RepID=A0A2V0QQI9_PSESF|nr:hypothetical protein KPSA1_04953 [Pseudomonas syringae pv. actinidiae]
MLGPIRIKDGFAWGNLVEAPDATCRVAIDKFDISIGANRLFSASLPAFFKVVVASTV